MIANKELVDNACKVLGDSILKYKEKYEKLESDTWLFLNEKELWDEFYEWREFREGKK